MKKITLILGLIFSSITWASDFYPSNVLLLDNLFSHHIIVAEKSTHLLYLFEKGDQGTPKLIKKVQMATGKKAGDKIFQGDHRTPEGVYHFTSFLTHQDLIKRHGKAGEIYGVGAFVMNYPNIIDRRRGKTGGGIWLHSTNDEMRIDKGLDSRGCIVTANKELIKIADFIELNKTPILVVENLKYLSKFSYETHRNKIQKTVNDWLNAWRNEDLNAYISFYHKKEFKNHKGQRIGAFKAYKRAVFSNPGRPDIEMKHVNILSADNYVVVNFEQIYASKTIQDTGKKTLYLKMDEYYNWKIVSETWSKLEGHEHKGDERIGFTPSMRFFKTYDPTSILTGQFTIKDNKRNN